MVYVMSTCDERFVKVLRTMAVYTLFIKSERRSAQRIQRWEERLMLQNSHIFQHYHSRPKQRQYRHRFSNVEDGFVKEKSYWIKFLWSLFNKEHKLYLESSNGPSLDPLLQFGSVHNLVPCLEYSRKPIEESRHKVLHRQNVIGD